MKEPSSLQMHKSLMSIMRGVNGQIFRALGNKVVYGPFKGMEIPQTTAWDDGNSSTKLLGSYEFELHEVIDKIVERQPKMVVNVGCAEGYYAVGFAGILPEAEVHAFDTDIESRVMCREYAKRNQVENRVFVTPGCMMAKELEVPGPERRLYFVDVEGAELPLLDTEACPALLKSDIVVECHEFLLPGLTQQLADRFLPSHTVTVVHPQLPPLDRYPFLQASPIAITLLAVVEKRPLPTVWLACWAKDY